MRHSKRHSKTKTEREKEIHRERGERDRETPDPIITFWIIGQKSKEEDLEFILMGNLTR